MKFPFSVIAFCVALISLVGCKSPKSSQNLILVTVPPYETIIGEIAGEIAEVKSVLSEDQNIHFYEPRPKDMAKYNHATVWFGVGEPFERRILQSLKDKQSIQYINLSHHLPLLELQGHSCHASSHIHTHTDHFPHADLHIWMSPVLMMQQADVIKEVLIKWKPEYRSTIETNAARVMSRLSQLDATIRSVLAPFANEIILVSHPSLGYFCHTYQLQQYAIECEGKTPSPKDMENLLRQLSQIGRAHV